ncbi:MAG: tetratricopeptide repeat protein [Gemmatimonadetes bacterium]|jgi:tetratricopeptide (TPR) repeat protein|nr:tetratricopeptide repeat protein [Gemmatimonadota bacterium]MBT6147107.1 tetratricopeptide repeat protein [Gemmatimonadota bacterium]MBT7859167.1 tetratricopeptide repeat protein [Gemmatimonadota bacterium]
MDRRVYQMGTLVCVALCLICVAQLQAQELTDGVNFVDERMLIPDAERFVDGSYIDSGVGLKFGVDKRLTYLAGDYTEAVNAFEEAVRTYRYKAEVWVYLARAYFYSESPELAKQTLQRASQVMPDLDDRLWNPLIASLLSEIRQRANQQQIRVDFYSPSQQEFLSLFRLYLFLEDSKAANGVIEAARQRSRSMLQQSTMVAGTTQGTYMDQSEQWEALAQSLSMELEMLGVAVTSVPEPVGSDSVVVPVDSAASQAAERERLLQLRIDFYKAGPEEFLELFDGYTARGDVRRARSVAERAGQEAARLTLVASVAATVQDELAIKQKAARMDSLVEVFLQQLPAPEPGP